MTLRAIATALLLGCYSTTPVDRPATFADLALGEQVPAALLIEAARDMEPCIGASLDLDGWTAWIVDDGTKCYSGACFLCPVESRAVCVGDLPAGCARDADCPCECGGLTDFDSKRIALAPGLVSLRHEVKHAGLLLYEHTDECWNECVNQGAP